jgi:hypothetical protein
MKGRTRIKGVSRMPRPKPSCRDFLFFFCKLDEDEQEKMRNRHGDLEDGELEGHQVDDSGSKQKNIAAKSLAH